MTGLVVPGVGMGVSLQRPVNPVLLGILKGNRIFLLPSGVRQRKCLCGNELYSSDTYSAYFPNYNKNNVLSEKGRIRPSDRADDRGVCRHADRAQPD